MTVDESIAQGHTLGRVTDQHYWAGAATLRVRASDVVPGFARFVIRCVEGEPEQLSGTFIAGGPSHSLDDTEAAELLLPRDFVGRATIAERRPGMFSLEGVLPWPEWRTLTDDESVASADSPVATERPAFLEVRSGSRITPRTWLRGEDLPLRPGIRVLLDYRPVEEILVPLDWFVSAGEAFDHLGARVAMIASSQVALGMLRQTGEHRPLEGAGARFQVFRDYAEARLWLLGDD